MKKRILSIGIFLTSILCFSACSNPDTTPSSPTVLSTPVIRYDNGTILWDEVKNAEKYEVSINNEIFITYNCYYNIPVTNDQLPYTVKVKSVSQTMTDSDFSQSLTFSARLLKKITNVSMNFNHNSDEYTLSWTRSDCEKYTICINQKKYITENNSLKTKSSDYVTGENIISVQPLGNTYDVIPEASTLSVEKSQPFADTSNIRIEDGCLIYGHNSIYSTNHLPSGKTNIIQISNIEENKIKSDGPIFSAYKVSPPKITNANLDLDRSDSSTWVIDIDGIASSDCEWIRIELFSSNDSFIGSDTCYKLNNEFGTAFVINRQHSLPYIQVVAGKTGCLNSNIVTKSVSY